MSSRPHSLHTETLRAVQSTLALADYLDTLMTRLKHESDGPSSTRNLLWISEAIAPVVPRLTKACYLGRRMKVEAAKIEPRIRMCAGPRGPLP
jgi:hypothetical protein